jgi:hypothetical protein
MNNMKHGKIEFEVVDPESGDADLFQIKKTAQNIRERMGKINAAEQWFVIGEELHRLHAKLAWERGGRRRGKPRPGDNERIGWKKAFELGLMPFSCSYAEYLISIYKFSKSTPVNHENLPSSIDALKAMVSCFKDGKLVKKLVDEGRITPASTRKNIVDLAHDLGLLAKRVRAPVNRDSPKSYRVAAALKILQRLNLTISDLKQGDK